MEGLLLLPIKTREENPGRDLKQMRHPPRLGNTLLHTLNPLRLFRRAMNIPQEAKQPSAILQSFPQICQYIVHEP
jgi:hypothetical protein